MLQRLSHRHKTQIQLHYNYTTYNYNNTHYYYLYLYLLYYNYIGHAFLNYSLTIFIINPTSALPLPPPPPLSSHLLLTLLSMLTGPPPRNLTPPPPPGAGAPPPPSAWSDIMPSWSSQRRPARPGGQSHLKPPPAAGTHRPPFWQGLGWQALRLFWHLEPGREEEEECDASSCRAEHLRYFLIFSIVKNDFFAFFIKLI